MNIVRVNRTAEKYLDVFKKRKFDGDNGNSFPSMVKEDFEKAGFEYDDFKSYKKIYPNCNSYTILMTPKDIEAVDDIQTVMNTIFTSFRYACKSDSYDYGTQWVSLWFIHAFRHLVDLTKSKFNK